MTKLNHFNTLGKDMNNLLSSVGPGILSSGLATTRSRPYDNGMMPDSILQEIIKENVKKTLMDK